MIQGQTLVDVLRMDEKRCKSCHGPISPNSRFLGLKEDGSFNWYHIDCAKELGLLDDRGHGLKGEVLKKMRKRIKASKLQYTEDDIESIEAILSLSPEDRLRRAVSLMVPMSSPLFHKEELFDHEC